MKKKWKGKKAMSTASLQRKNLTKTARSQLLIPLRVSLVISSTNSRKIARSNWFPDRRFTAFADESGVDFPESEISWENAAQGFSSC